MIESFEWIGIIGLILEIIGFIFMLKYYGRPFPREEYTKWEKEHVKEDEKKSNFVEKSFTWREDFKIIDWNKQPIHKKFWYNWLLKTKVPIIMIIVGLAFQVIQIGLD